MIPKFEVELSSRYSRAFIRSNSTQYPLLVLKYLDQESLERHKMF